MENIVIMQAMPEDAEAVIEYCKVIGAESENLSYGAEGISQTAESEAEYLKKIYDAENQIFLLAKAGDRIVGTANYVGFSKPRMAHRGEIGISVLKAMWGQHIGTMLMQEMITFAKEEAKAEIISLEVRSDNERAIALYQKFGFEKIGHFPGFFKIDGKNVDFDLMNLYL